MSTRQDRLPASQGEGARALLRASGLWYGTPTFLSVYIPRPQCRSLSEWLLLKIFPPPPHTSVHVLLFSGMNYMSNQFSLFHPNYM